MRHEKPNRAEGVAFKQIYAERDVLCQKRKEIDKMLDTLNNTENEMIVEAKARLRLLETDILSYSPEMGTFFVQAAWTPEKN